MDRLTISNAVKAFEKQSKPYVELFEHGSLSVEYYAPEKVDRQTPHDRDEVYVVISGSGTFLNGDTEQPFEAGEVLFVPAYVEHRFKDFSDDFATWVIFYGPPGGESEHGESE